MSRDKRHVFWSDNNESAEKTNGGERCVDLIVNDDDICFQHILPRLNSTDVKFLYE